VSALTGVGDILRPARAAIHIEGLHHSFGRGDFSKPVLDDVRLALDVGEIAIMTGPSGSGKTTLLTLIGALRAVQEGRLQIMGRELNGLSARELVAVRRSIGFIFQAHNLFESLTAYQNVRMAVDLSDLPDPAARSAAEHALSMVDLGHRLHYRPSAMSGGQRQRVAIARALVNRPRLILADEPTAALDKDSGREVVTLLRSLAKENGSTIVLVTHDSRILDVADRIINLVDGRIASDVVVHESVVICEFLAKCPVFSGLPPGTLSHVAEQMKGERYAAGTTLIRQGDPGDKFYVIRHGHADVVTGGRLLTTLGEGEFFGEAALLTDQPRNATVVAADDIMLYTMSKPEFTRALQASGTLREQLLRVFFQRQ
jgi:putative ABC transport system ATP-binding protein